MHPDDFVNNDGAFGLMLTFGILMIVFSLIAAYGQMSISERGNELLAERFGSEWLNAEREDLVLYRNQDRKEILLLLKGTSTMFDRAGVLLVQSVPGDPVFGSNSKLQRLWWSPLIDYRPNITLVKKDDFRYSKYLDLYNLQVERFGTL